MKTDWFKKLVTQEEKDLRRRELLAVRHQFECLLEVLDDKIPKTPSSVDYESPSWAYLQADRIGYTRAIKDVIDLISFDDKPRK